MKHDIVPAPADPAGICRAAIGAASDLNCPWRVEAPRRPGSPFVIKIWDPEPRELTPEEKGQTRLELGGVA